MNLKKLIVLFIILFLPTQVLAKESNNHQFNFFIGNFDFIEIISKLGFSLIISARGYAAYLGNSFQEIAIFIFVTFFPSSKQTKSCPLDYVLPPNLILF